MSTPRYKITVKTAGWEKEEIPDQLFIPRSDSVKKKPDQLDFDASRFKPVRNNLGVPKPWGGLWTSDYHSEKKTSPWFEWLIQNEPGWIPEGDSGLILRPDPELTKAYHINDPDDYYRLQRDFPAYHHQLKDDDGRVIPGKELETINFPELFEPERKGGAGLHALRVNQDALDLLKDEFKNWDIPSTVWTPGSPLKEVGRMNPRKEMPKRYEDENPFRRRSSSSTEIESLFQKLAHLDNIGDYRYADYISERLVNAQNNPDEIEKIVKEAGLKDWFKEKWVDVSRPKKKGKGYEACGRGDTSKGKKPVCTPANKAKNLTEKERKTRIRQKRKKEKEPNPGKKPNITTYTENAGGKSNVSNNHNIKFVGSNIDNNLERK